MSASRLFNGVFDLEMFFCHFSVTIILMNTSGIKICTYLSLYAVNPKKSKLPDTNVGKV